MNLASRIKPPMAADNAWWWEQAAQNVLAIQRCTGCQTLRHPPKPMCKECQSLQWDFIPASGHGTVTSFTSMEHPKFPGYDYPIYIALIDLEEGVRITSQLVDVERQDIQFGMAVKLKFHTDPDGFVLPVFAPAGEKQ